MSFLANVKKSRSSNIWLLRMEDNLGNKCYFYLRTDSLKQAILERQIGKNNVNIRDYGVIIATGFGENPSAKVVNRMKAEYGFEESA